MVHGGISARFDTVRSVEAYLQLEDVYITRDTESRIYFCRVEKRTNFCNLHSGVFACRYDGN